MDIITQLIIETRLMALKKELEDKKAQRVALQWLTEFAREEPALDIQMQAAPETVMDCEWEFAEQEDLEV